MKKAYQYKPCENCGRNVVHADGGCTLCLACEVSTPAERKDRATTHKELMGIKIVATDEYYNEVHYKWLPVPPHWVGLRTTEVEHRIFREQQ